MGAPSRTREKSAFPAPAAPAAAEGTDDDQHLGPRTAGREEAADEGGRVDPYRRAAGRDDEYCHESIIVALRLASGDKERPDASRNDGPGGGSEPAQNGP